MPKTKAKTPPKGRTTLKVDFSDTESRGGEKRKGAKHYKPGDYLVVVSKVPETGKSENKKTPFIEFTYKFVDGKYKGNEITDRCYLSSGALWRLRNALEGMGLKVPSKAVNIDLKKCKGRELGITIDDEEGDNEKVYSRVVDTYKAELVEESDEDEEDEEDEDEDIDEEDEDEEEEDEAEDEEEEDDLEELDLDEI